MRKKSLLCILTVCTLSVTTIGGCSTGTPDPVSEETTAESSSKATEDCKTETDTDTEAGSEADASEENSQAVTTGGSPWIDSDLKENISKDMKTDPKDDFHLYINKDWLLSNNIPDGYPTWSHYSECAKTVKEKGIALLTDESVKGHDADNIRAYSKAILDWDARDKAGLSEITDCFNSIVEAKTIDDINKLLMDPDKTNELHAFIAYTVGKGLNDPRHYLVVIDSPELLLNDSAEYKKRTEFGDILYGYNKDVFIYIAEKAGLSKDDADKIFENAIKFEGVLADTIYTTEEQNNDDYLQKINNEMSFDELTAMTENYPLSELLKADKLYYDGKYLVSAPEYIKKLDSVYTNDNLDGIKAIIAVHYILSYRYSLDKETYEFCVDKRNEYTGTSGKLPDKEMAYEMVTSQIPASIQKVYVEKYGSEEDRKKMIKLCQTVKDTYREILEENEWISDESRKAAIEKLEKIKIHAAYPDKFRNTDSLDLTGCSLVEANRRINNFEADYNRSLIDKEPDNDMWAENLDILSCNAFYNLQDNTINMIIGMMDEPFYSDKMSTEELYASIGAFWAGHEISHAFDNNGAQFDADGNLKDWWTEEDKTEFRKRTKKVDDYLDTIIAFNGKHMTGTNIDTEMISDITGLQCALKMASKVENFDYAKFFKKYAELNVAINLYSSELSLLSQDNHPLNYSRTNVPVQQFEEFYETFDVKEGDNMYLAPEDRLLVWR